MNVLCLGLGLVISPTKTDVVFNGLDTRGSWRISSHFLPEHLAFLANLVACCRQSHGWLTVSGGPSQAASKVQAAGVW